MENHKIQKQNFRPQTKFQKKDVSYCDHQIYKTLAIPETFFNYFVCIQKQCEK